MSSNSSCVHKLTRVVIKAWRAAMESKGLRVNMKKPKFPVHCVNFDVPEHSCVNSKCGNSSIKCSRSKLGVNKKCKGITSRLAADPGYVWPKRYQQLNWKVYNGLSFFCNFPKYQSLFNLKVYDIYFIKCWAQFPPATHIHAWCVRKQNPRKTSKHQHKTTNCLGQIIRLLHREH